MTARRCFSQHQININEDRVVKDWITAAMHCRKCTKNLMTAAKHDSLSF